MDFDLSEEQMMLKDGLNRLFSDYYTFEKRSSILKSEQGWSSELWDRLAEMGLMALPFSEADGGLGGGPIELMIVMEAFGRALALEPYFGTVVLGGSVLKTAGSRSQRAGLVPKIAEGSLKLALAVTERNARYDLHHVGTSARKDGNSYILTGRKSVVLDGDCADKLFVTARLAGSDRDANGIGLFLVDRSAKGVTLQKYALQDGRRAAELSLDSVKIGSDCVFGDPEHGLPIVRRAVEEGIAALAAEAVGVMSAMHDLTVEYMKVRKQFGAPIGSFQILQHKAVDMFIATEQARSLMLFAAMMSESRNDQERAKAMSAVKAGIGRNGRQAGEIAIQLHGGVGMTMEYAVGHYFKRMTMIDLTFGDSAYHLAQAAKTDGLFSDS